MAEKIKILPYGLRGDGTYKEDKEDETPKERTRKKRGRPKTIPRFTFGKHIDEEPRDVPTPYLRWFMRNNKGYTSRIRQEVIKVLKQRNEYDQDR